MMGKHLERQPSARRRGLWGGAVLALLARGVDGALLFRTRTTGNLYNFFI